MSIDEPTLSPHDGTPIEQCPVKAGDLILVRESSHEDMKYHHLYAGFVGRVTSDTLHFPFHTGRGWSFWVNAVDSNSPTQQRVFLWDPEKLRIISEETCKMILQRLD
jgi:hypothetical protein